MVIILCHVRRKQSLHCHLQVCNAILNERIVCERAWLPNLYKAAVKTNCSPVKSVSKPFTVTGSHGPQSEEQAKSYLGVTQLFSPSCVLLTERQNRVPACYA